tara:strand:+ start:143 stop:703 length:561 start_codon:yes stop_codon:yes gene_type:complete
MVLSDEEKREQKRVYANQWYHKNKEKLKEKKRIQSKEYYQKNKEKRKEYHQTNKEAIKEKRKKWRENNKEKLRIQHKKYRENNIEKLRIRDKKYHQENKEKIKEYQQTPKGKKSLRISKWKQAGLICDDYDSLYCHYLTAETCDHCNIPFGEFGDGTGTFKCMDHNHKTGLFRNFLCSKCNIIRGE